MEKLSHEKAKVLDEVVVSDTVYIHYSFTISFAFSVPTYLINLFGRPGSTAIPFSRISLAIREKQEE